MLHKKIIDIKKDKIKYTQINLPLKTNTLDNASDYFNKLQKKVNIFLKKKIIYIVFFKRRVICCDYFFYLN